MIMAKYFTRKRKSKIPMPISALQRDRDYFHYTMLLLTEKSSKLSTASFVTNFFHFSMKNCLILVTNAIEWHNSLE